MELRKMLWFRPLPSAILRRHPDVAAVLVLFALTGVGAWDLMGTETVVGMDAATQAYPWHSFLGESLSSGDIPAWNPHQFSGTPFAADPLSGWTYLPAMLLFALLPLAGAAKSYLFLHLLLAGLSVYALARSLGMGLPGALLAAVAYEFNGFLYLSNTCCFGHVPVVCWLPLVILGAELAIRSSGRLERVLWWGISGLALSQILASWLGQGTYYALLTLGGYIAYRILLFPPGSSPSGEPARQMAFSYETLGTPFLGDPTTRIRLGSLPGICAKVAIAILKLLRKAVPVVGSRLSRCVLHGGAVLAFGFDLAAAGVLPRLEFNALSNLAGGYPDAEGGAGAEETGGWFMGDWGLLLEPGYYWYAGIAVLSLALVAPLLALGRYAVPYFAALALGALILSGQGPTLLHAALYLLPLFDQVHPHRPERVMLVFYLGAALLAGATLSVLGERARNKPLLLVLPALAALLLAGASILISLAGIPEETGEFGGWKALSEDGVPIPVGSLLALIPAVSLVAVYALMPARLAAWRNLAFALLVLVVFADLLAANRYAIAEQSYVARKIDLAEHYGPSGAGRFLQSRDGEEPFRYFGYDPQHAYSGSYGGTFFSLIRFTDPNVRALEMNNRAMSSGLQSIQGYSAIHIARYDEYMRALNNGYEQNYHYADVLERGLNSPLLDLLNARYIVVPADRPPENQPGLQQVLRTEHPTVYEDDRSKVLENREALSRAWIVHSARQVRSREEALDLLSVGQVDPRETALLEEAPPEMSRPENPSADQASVTEYEANRIELETITEAPGLLVLSEVYYPAWKAYVDGRPAPVYATDHLLRSVPVPEGEHTVELRYESWTLRAGIAISLVTCTALIALAIIVGVHRWRQKGTVGEAKS
jgi:hypothetical protein